MATNSVVRAVFLLVALASIVRLFLVAKDQLRAPFDLTFESPNLCTIKAIEDGKHIYDQAIYENLAFFLAIYTPKYHHWIRFHKVSNMII